MMANTPPKSKNGANFEQKGFHALCAIDAPERLPNHWHRLRHQAAFFVASDLGKSLLLGVVVWLASVAVLGWHFIAWEASPSTLAKSTLIATRSIEVVDEEATQLKLEQLKASLPPVYLASQGLNDQMRQALTAKLDAVLALMRPTAEVPLERRQEDFAKLLDGSAEAERLFTKLTQAKQRWAADAYYWDTITMAAQATLERVMKAGVTEQHYLDQRDLLIDRALPASLAPIPEERGLVKLLVKSVLRPNRLIDKKAQQIAYKSLEAKLLPVVREYRRGDIITTQGEPVSPLQRKALDRLGIALGHTRWQSLLGLALFTLLLLGTLWGFLKNHQRGKWLKPSYTAFMGSMTLVALASYRVVMLLGPAWPTLLFPMATFAMLATILLNAPVAILGSAVVVMLLLVPLHLDPQSLLVLSMGSIAGAFTLSRTKQLKDRRQLMLAAFVVAMVQATAITALFFINSATDTDWTWGNYALSLAAGIGSGLLSGVLTVGLLPLIEAAFKLLSPFTLLELANHDQPLLRRLQFEAPGTFHHSVMLSNLSEAAAEAIGANVLLTRVGCLYHDIGKMRRPLYYIENQAYFGSDNPHDRLPPRLSKRVITAHPKDSLEMAAQYNLPESIQAFMTEHHGTLMCGYFYHKAVQEEGADNVIKDQFRYAGPKPRSKETAIAMLADAVESAVRALKSPTLGQVEDLVDKLFKQRIDDHQFDDCPITFSDLRVIRDTFIRVLMGIQHNRINYQDKILKEYSARVAGAGVQPSLTQPSGS
jgi:hypothetical protein